MVKRFQTIHQFSVDAARGLVLLFGIGTKESGMLSTSSLIRASNFTVHHPHLETEVAQSGAQIVLNGDGLRLQQLAMGQ